MFHAARLAALVVVGALALAGCSFTNQITTQLPYSASDGIRMSLGDTIRAKNLLIVTEAEGSRGVLTGGVTNSGSQDAIVAIEVEGAGNVEVSVPAGATVLIPGDVEAEFPAIPAIPGSTLPITLSTGSEGSVSATIPILDGTLPEYAALLG